MSCRQERQSITRQPQLTRQIKLGQNVRIPSQSILILMHSSILNIRVHQLVCPFSASFSSLALSECSKNVAGIARPSLDWIMRMLRLISPTGPHGFNGYVPCSMAPCDDTYNLQQILAQGFAPESPVIDYVNPQLLQPSDETGIHWEEPLNYPL